MIRKIAVSAVLGLGLAQSVQAALITNPADPRNWQGATVSTFAGLFSLTNAQVVANQLLDDGNFDPTGYSAATMIKYNGVDMLANPGYGTYGTSLDQPNVVNPGNDGTYNYSLSGVGAGTGANGIDQNWVQTDNVVGNTIFDLGFQATKAAVFNTIDHGPLPQEAIESTVYLSNDLINWTQAVTERVWLEGIYSDTSVVWDGFAYAVGTGTSSTFRYASVIWGGPGSLHADGDNEINGIMGLQANFTGSSVPEPASLALLSAGLLLLGAARRRR